jgi:hypothetical protein
MWFHKKKFVSGRLGDFSTIQGAPEVAKSFPNFVECRLQTVHNQKGTSKRTVVIAVADLVSLQFEKIL